MLPYFYVFSGSNTHQISNFQTCCDDNGSWICVNILMLALVNL